MLDSYLYLIVPIFSYGITQMVKLAFDGIKGNFDISHMYSTYGGMPSAHSAFVVSLAAYVGLENGITNALFAVTLVFALIALRDAMGFRRQIGKHAYMLNRIRDTLPEQNQKQLPALEEQVGHTTLEVFVGSVFGLAIAVLAHVFF